MAFYARKKPRRTVSDPVYRRRRLTRPERRGTRAQITRRMVADSISIYR